MPRILFLVLLFCVSCENNKNHSNNSFLQYLENIETVNTQAVKIYNEKSTSLSSPLKLIVNDMGNILVVNYLDWTLHYISENGSLINKVGGKGRGPGEFVVINELNIGCDGLLYVLDKKQAKISSYAIKINGLQHIKDILLPDYSALSLHSFYSCSEKGKFGVFKNFRPRDNNFNSLSVYELDKNLQFKDKTIDFKSDEVIKSGEEVQDNILGFKNYWNFHDGKLYYTYSNSFNVQVMQLSTGTKHTVSSPKTPSFDMDEGQKSAMLDRFGPYLSAMPGLEDEINTRKILPYFHSYTANETYSYFTVLNVGYRDGIILRLNHETQEKKKIESPKLFQLFDVVGNKLYGIQNSEEGEQSVVIITLEE